MDKRRLSCLIKKAALLGGSFITCKEFVLVTYSVTNRRGESLSVVQKCFYGHYLPAERHKTNLVHALVHSNLDSQTSHCKSIGCNGIFRIPGILQRAELEAFRLAALFQPGLHSSALLLADRTSLAQANQRILRTTYQTQAITLNSLNNKIGEKSLNSFI